MIFEVVIVTVYLLHNILNLFEKAMLKHWINLFVFLPKIYDFIDIFFAFIITSFEHLEFQFSIAICVFGKSNLIKIIVEQPIILN